MIQFLEENKAKLTHNSSISLICVMFFLTLQNTVVRLTSEEFGWDLTLHFLQFPLEQKVAPKDKLQHAKSSSPWKKGLWNQKKVLEHRRYGSDTLANGLAYDLFRDFYIAINRMLGQAVPQVDSAPDELFLGISFADTVANGQAPSEFFTEG